MPTTTTRRPALTPGTMRREVRRVQREIAPDAQVEFTGRVRTQTFPRRDKAGATWSRYVLAMTVNGTPMTAVYGVGTDGLPSTLTFTTAVL